MGHILNLVPKGIKAYAPSSNPIANCIGFRVTGAGDVTFDDGVGNTSTVTMPAGGELKVRVTKITAATATGLFIFVEA